MPSGTFQLYFATSKFVSQIITTSQYELLQVIQLHKVYPINLNNLTNFLIICAPSSSLLCSYAALSLRNKTLLLISYISLPL